MRILAQFKEKYNLTWSGVAHELGRSLRAVEQWHSKGRVPLPWKVLLLIFSNYPELYDKYKKYFKKQ